MQPLHLQRGVALLALLLMALGSDACDSKPSSRADAQSPSCASCHLPDYRAVTHPPHVNVKPTECQVCHSSESWHPSILNHEWPLTGAHKDKAQCADCHQGKPPVYQGIGKRCIDCHRDDYEGASYPGHSRFATTCEDCHSTEAFRPARKPGEATLPAPEQAVAPHRRAGHASSTSSAEAARGVPSQNRPTAQTSAQELPAPEPATPTATPPNKPVHPERRFPIRSGSHSGIECATCHDQGGPMGKDDTDCVQCHTRERFDHKHVRVSNYPLGPAPANFCVHCHTDGSVDSAR
jgi:hypothetical protein